MQVPSLRKKPITKQFLNTQSVTGQRMDTLGTIPITLTIGSFTTSLTVQVVRGVNRQFLLGWDFFCSHKAKIDIEHAMLTLANHSCPLVSFPRDSPICCNVHVSSPVTIPSLSESHISVTLKSPTLGYTPDAYTGIFEPDYYPRDLTLAMARTLSHVHAGQTLIRIMNPNKHDVTLHPGTRIGQFYSVSNNPQSEYSIPDGSPSVSEISSNHEAHLPPVDISQDGISPSQRKEVENLLTKFSDVFSTGPNDYGRTDLVTHRIRTGDASPVRQRAYRASPTVRNEIRKQVDTLLDQDVIEESHSPWSSPIVMVKKKDGSYRFCIDYRKLNKVTVKDSHPLPRTDDTLDALSGSVYFSTIDLSSGYWQVAVHPEDSEKTAFTTGDGLYQFKVMPMGLTNAPPTFQRLMELVLRGLHWSTRLVYLDDVIVVGKSFSDHMTNLEQVLSRFRDANLKLKPSKCHFLHTQVRFLGHVVSKDGILPDPSNTNRVLDWPTPRNASEVRSFLGLCSYYRRFVKNFAHCAAPLHRLTQRDVPFDWTTECEDAFTSLRDALIHAPVMAYPDVTKPFILFTDASNSAIGAVLSQVQNGRERVIAYASHVLTAAEKRWSTYDRELWAIVWSVRHFRHYLACTSFTIVTDHKPLVGLRKLPIHNDRTGRRSRWALELDPYEWHISHRDGSRHGNADALSRCPTVATAVSVTDTALSNPSAPRMINTQPTPPPLPIPKVAPVSVPATPQHSPTSPSVDPADPQSLLTASCTLTGMSCDVKTAQRNDPDIQQVITWVNTRNRPPRSQLRKLSRPVRRLWLDFPKLAIVNELLCRKSCPMRGTPHVWQVIIPQSLQPTILANLHGDGLVGHFSAHKTYQRSLSICYWPYIRRDIDS